MCQNVKTLSLCSVILNEVKNLNTSTTAFQILRDAQDDNLIGMFHFDTLSFLFMPDQTAGKPFPLIFLNKSSAKTSVMPEM